MQQEKYMHNAERYPIIINDVDANYVKMQKVFILNEYILLKKELNGT